MEVTTRKRPNNDTAYHADREISINILTDDEEDAKTTYSYESGVEMNLASVFQTKLTDVRSGIINVNTERSDDFLIHVPEDDASIISYGSDDEERRVSIGNRPMTKQRSVLADINVERGNASSMNCVFIKDAFNFPDNDDYSDTNDDGHNDVYDATEGNINDIKFDNYNDDNGRVADDADVKDCTENEGGEDNDGDRSGTDDMSEKEAIRDVMENILNYATENIMSVLNADVIEKTSKDITINEPAYDHINDDVNGGGDNKRSDEDTKAATDKNGHKADDDDVRDVPVKGKTYGVKTRDASNDDTYEIEKEKMVNEQEEEMIEKEKDVRKQEKRKWHGEKEATDEYSVGGDNEHSNEDNKADEAMNCLIVEDVNGNDKNDMENTGKWHEKKYGVPMADVDEGDNCVIVEKERDIREMKEKGECKEKNEKKQKEKEENDDENVGGDSNHLNEGNKAQTDKTCLINNDIKKHDVTNKSDGLTTANADDGVYCEVKKKAVGEQEEEDVEEGTKDKKGRGNVEKEENYDDNVDKEENEKEQKKEKVNGVKEENNDVESDKNHLNENSKVDVDKIWLIKHIVYESDEIYVNNKTDWLPNSDNEDNGEVKNEEEAGLQEEKYDEKEKGVENDLEKGQRNAEKDKNDDNNASDNDPLNEVKNTDEEENCLGVVDENKFDENNAYNKRSGVTIANAENEDDYEVKEKAEEVGEKEEKEENKDEKEDEEKDQDDEEGDGEEQKGEKEQEVKSESHEEEQENGKEEKIEEADIVLVVSRDGADPQDGVLKTISEKSHRPASMRSEEESFVSLPSSLFEDSASGEGIVEPFHRHRQIELP